MTTRTHLRVSQPLDLDATLDGGQAFRWRRDGDAWVGVLGSAIVRLARTDGGVDIESDVPLASDIEGAIASYLRLDDDLPAIQRELATDPHIGDGVRAFPGLRLLRQDPWETLAGFILSSTSNIPRIARTMELIADTLGQPLELGDTTRHAFPAPEAFVRAGETQLRDLRCGFRAPYLVAAARAVATGELALEALREAPYAEALAALSALPGVGDKIADCVMLFSLDHLEAFPVDRWIHRALVDWYGAESTFRYEALRDWAAGRFGPLAGYANQYLFWHIRQSRRPMIGAALTKPLAPKAGS
jgi:N-glycosylase/DNA lyase